MSDRTAIYDKISDLVEPFNKKEIALSEATTFQGDLE